MVLIEDTRQKTDKHTIKHESFEKMGDKLVRCKLPFGDYIISPLASVDTKENIAEIAQNIGNDHERFKRECILAKESGCQLYVLVENEEGITSIDGVRYWVNPRLCYEPRAITGERLEKAMRTMSERYGVKFRFCHPRDSAEMIKKLLEEGQHGRNA